MSGQEEKEGLQAREMSRTPVDIKPSPKGRLLKEMAVYELLEKLEISYQRVDHEAAATVDDCHDVDEALGIHICKNLFLCNRQKTDFYLLMMPGLKKGKAFDRQGAFAGCVCGLPSMREYVQSEAADEGYIGEVSALCGARVYGGGVSGRVVYITQKQLMC